MCLADLLCVILCACLFKIKRDDHRSYSFYDLSCYPGCPIILARSMHVFFTADLARITEHHVLPVVQVPGQGCPIPSIMVLAGVFNQHNLLA